jgi:hypothetical protein
MLARGGPGNRRAVVVAGQDELVGQVECVMGGGE